jgi:hypothetical protein
MSSRFYALHIPNGESFLLITEHQGKEKSILIDSGKIYSPRKKHPLVTAIEKAEPDLSSIDIAICTHQDTDHSNGFKTFADKWCGSRGKSIGEFWLPGRWSTAVPDIIVDPIFFIKNLHTGSRELADLLEEEKKDSEGIATGEFGLPLLSERLRSTQLKEKLLEYFRGCQIETDEEGIQNETEPDQDIAYEARQDELRLSRSLGLSPEDLARVRNNLEDSGEFDIFQHIPFVAPCGVYAFFDPTPFSTNSMLAAKLFYTAIETAKSIHAIVESAVRWTIPIRWFDFGLFENNGMAKGGDVGFLEPICAVELEKPPTAVPGIMRSLCLSLSIQNVESLVFMRMENNKEPAVLFVGDSRLSFGQSRPVSDFPKPRNIPARKMLITAPHHGSKVNDNAYSVLSDWLTNKPEDNFFVRNGGKAGQPLGRFKSLPHRACAQCIQCNGKGWNQVIKVTTTSACWDWPPSSFKACK